MELDVSHATLEKLFSKTKRKQRYIIGVPIEREFDESRVGLTPQAVSLLIEAGHEVRVEANAGAIAGFSNVDYLEAGASIVGIDEVLDADVIFKILPLNLMEIERLKFGATVFSIANNRMQSEKYFSSLIKKKVTAIAYDTLQGKKGNLIMMDAICKIVGNACPLIAGEYFSSCNKNRGYLIGSVASFLIDIGLFTAFQYLLGDKVSTSVNILIATIGARIVSSLFNFFYNRSAVFESEESVGKTMLRYYILCVCQMGVSYGFVNLLAMVTEASKALTSVIKVLVDIILFIISFQIQRKWVFSTKKED